MFVALYLPVLPPGKKNPSIIGFRTEKCAYEYIYSQMCSGCKEERQAALDGVEIWEEYEDEDGQKHGHAPSLHPGCACEWDVIPHENFTEAEIEELSNR